MAVVLRIDLGAIQVQVVGVVIIVRHRRPIVAVGALIVGTAAAAVATQDEGRAAGALHRACTIIIIIEGLEL